jgi:hypothetical protein
VFFIGAARQVAAKEAAVRANGDIVKEFGHGEKQRNGSDKSSKMVCLIAQTSPEKADL